MSAQAELIEGAAARASSEEAAPLEQWARQLRSSEDPSSLAVGLDEKLLQLIQHYPERDLASLSLESGRHCLSVAVLLLSAQR